MTNNSVQYFHYTTGNLIHSIISHGYLKRSRGHTNGESPVLWFSRNQRFEQTSRQGVISQSVYIPVLEESLQHKMWINVRFGIPSDDSRLMDWDTTCKVVGTPPRVKRELQKTGRDLGGYHRDWYGVLTEVSIDELTFQVWDGSNWIDKNVRDWYHNEYSLIPYTDSHVVITEHYKRKNPKGWMNNTIFNNDTYRNLSRGMEQGTPV